MMRVCKVRSLLLATAAIVCSTAAEAQTLTFNSISPSQWQRGMPWAPQGNKAPDQSSWWPGANAIPSDANPVLTSAAGMVLAVFPRPPDFPASSAGGAEFIGGVVNTKGSFSQLYGYFQITAQMSSAAGSMSAFYLNAEDGTWPPEIDVIEALGNSQTMLTNTIHTGASEQSVGTIGTVTNMTSGFHTYAVDWEADYITWYFDGKQTFRTATPADMHKPMFMIADTCTGTATSWEGYPPSGELLGAMTIASIEVWTSNPHLPPPTVTSSTTPTPGADGPLGATGPSQTSATSIQASVAAQIQQSEAQMATETTAADQQIIAAQSAPQIGLSLIQQGDALGAQADALLAGVLAVTRH